MFKPLDILDYDLTVTLCNSDGFDDLSPELRTQLETSCKAYNLPLPNLDYKRFRSDEAEKATVIPSPRVGGSPEASSLAPVTPRGPGSQGDEVTFPELFSLGESEDEALNGYCELGDNALHQLECESIPEEEGEEEDSQGICDMWPHDLSTYTPDIVFRDSHAVSVLRLSHKGPPLPPVPADQAPPLAIPPYDGLC